LAGRPWQGGLAEQRAVRQKTVPALREAAADGSSDVPRRGRLDVPRSRAGHVSSSSRNPEQARRELARAAGGRVTPAGAGRTQGGCGGSPTRTELLSTPAKSLASRNSFELCFCSQEQKCSSPEAQWFSRGGNAWMYCSKTLFLWWRPLASHALLLLCEHFSRYPLFSSRKQSFCGSVLWESGAAECPTRDRSPAEHPGLEPAWWARGCTSALRFDRIAQSINSADSRSLSKIFSRCFYFYAGDERIASCSWARARISRWPALR